MKMVDMPDQTPTTGHGALLGSSAKQWIGIVAALLAATGVGVGTFDTNREQTLVQEKQARAKEDRQVVRESIRTQWRVWSARADEQEAEIDEHGEELTALQEQLAAHIRADNRVQNE